MRVRDYKNFKLENKIDKYFSGEITLEQVNIDYYLLSVNEKWSDNMVAKLATMLLKGMDGVKRVAEGGMKVLKRILKFLWKIAKGVGRLCDKYKHVCMFIVLVIIMITIGAVQTYAASNPTDPNIVEIANAALAFLDQISDRLVDQGGANDSSITIAKSILTEIRNGGADMDYSQISKEADELAKLAMKKSQELSETNPDAFSKLADAGSQLGTKFTYIVKGAKDLVLGG